MENIYETYQHMRKRMKYFLVFILFLAFGSSGYTEDEVWDGKAMFCVSMTTDIEEKYYGLVFYSGKVKRLSIHEDTLHIPDDSAGKPYSLVKVFSARKVFWRGLSEVNSLDRKNFLHLLGGKEHGWCRPYTQRLLTEKLFEKIQDKIFGKVSRSIADDLE